MGISALPVNYSGCLFVTVGETGFGLSLLFPFRFLSPPLFIPWSDVESVQEKRSLLRRYTEIRIRGRRSKIQLAGAAGKELHRTYVRIVQGKTSPP
jgi:hypothetical protein